MTPLSGLDRDRVVWGAVGVVLAGFVVVLLVAFVGALVFGLFLYYALRPIYRRLEAHTDHPDLAATVTLLVVGLPMLLTLGYAVLVGYQELSQLLGAQPLGEARSVLQPYLDVGALTRPRRIVEVTRQNLDSLVGYAGLLLAWGVRLFVIVAVAFYLLRDDRKIAGWYRETFAAVDAAIAFGEGVDDDLTTIYTGNLITIGITALIAALTYYAVEFLADPTVVAYPLLLGMLIGIGTVVPAVGMKIIYLPFAGYLFVRSLVWNQLPVWIPVAFLAVTVVVIDTLPDVVIRSYVSKGDINMGLMMLSYVFGATAFGWYGVFFGPVVMVLALHFAEDLLPRLVAGRPLALPSD